MVRHAYRRERRRQFTLQLLLVDRGRVDVIRADTLGGVGQFRRHLALIAIGRIGSAIGWTTDADRPPTGAAGDCAMSERALGLGYWVIRLALSGGDEAEQVCGFALLLDPGEPDRLLLG